MLTCLLLAVAVMAAPLVGSATAAPVAARGLRGGASPARAEEERRLALPGFTDHTVQHQYMTRSFMMYIPSTVSASQPATGLVLLFHGYTVSAENTCDGSHAYSFAAQREADDHGFIVVCPRGTGTPGKDSGWNANGQCCGKPNIGTVDDVGFVRSMLDELEHNLLPNMYGLAYPTQNVFAMGFSTGGLFSYRLGCELGERFDGIAPTGAAWKWAFGAHIMWGWSSQCKGGPSVYNTIGDLDHFTTADLALQKWRQYSRDNLKCAPSAEETLSLSGGDVTCHTYASCGGEQKKSKFCAFDGHHHSVIQMGGRYGVWHLEHAWAFLAKEPKEPSQPSPAALPGPGQPSESPCADLPDVKKTCPGDGCKVLAGGMTNRTCADYCLSKGHTCLGAWEEVNNDCDVKATLTCDQVWPGTSDLICECGQSALPPLAPEPEAEAPAGCRSVQPGEPCYVEIEWAKDHGIHEHPEWYPGLAASSSLGDFQAFFHASGLHSGVCPTAPC